MKKRILFLSIVSVLLLSITCMATNYYNANYNNYNVSPYSYDSMLNSILEMMIFVYAIAIILAIIRIIAICFIFDLAGQPWWKAIIPIYNAIVLYKIVGLSPWLLLLHLFALIPLVGEIIAFIVAIVLSIVIAIKLAKAFDKSVSFTIGLIFLPTIFYCILAFGNSEYQLINRQDELFNIANTNKNENKKNSKKSKQDEYIVVDPETGEEINPDFYKPMDLTDYKPRSDFFK